jgi:FMN reductase
MTRIAAVLGSVTPPGRLHRALTQAAERAGSGGATVDVLDLANFRLDFVDGRPAAEHDDDSQRLIDAVVPADAVILATPVYRASYTGALKNALDWLPIESMRDKPVGIVAMGTSPYHYLAVDSHLRSVLAWFGALVAPTSVYLAAADFSEGELSDNAAHAMDELFSTCIALATAVGDTSLGPTPLAARGRR